MSIDFMPLEADVVVVGEGIAGLMTALQARKAGADVVVLGLGIGASGWLQGLNVALESADAGDNTRVHSDDILREGKGLAHPWLVQDTVAAAVPAFNELAALGVEFARDGGRPRQRHASGSTFPRCCYVADMMWGPRAAQILRTELSRLGVHRRRLRAVRLLKHDGRVTGVIAVPLHGAEAILIGAGAVVLANGGLGRLLPKSTYPADVFGSSAAMALMAGAYLADLEFIQFEPLVGCKPEAIEGYVIPTTLFGDGAVLRDVRGTRFLLESRPQGEAGIGKEDLVREMLRMREEQRNLLTGGIWLDATTIHTEVINRYPWLAKFMRRSDIDLSRSMVEVWPAAHTSLGGVRVDRTRQASVPGLFAAGEAAAGIHGAGRLAGGSGTDVIASGWICGRSAAASARTVSRRSSTDLKNLALSIFDPAAPDLRGDREAAAGVAAEIGKALARGIEVVRSEARLVEAKHLLAGLSKELPADGCAHPASPWLPVFDQLLVAQVTVLAALKRTESRGAHLRLDYPYSDLEQQFSLTVSMDRATAAPIVTAESGLHA